MRQTITRYEFDLLDCVYIQACERHRARLLETIRGYFFENREHGFGDWKPESNDEELFLYAYAKYTLSSASAPLTIARARDDWEMWKYRRKIPDYLCSYYRNALWQRIEIAA
ncbi:MAG: hypothetical protein V4682_01865 [Patescibacteria group bacterium]